MFIEEMLQFPREYRDVLRSHHRKINDSIDALCRTFFETMHKQARIARRRLIGFPARVAHGIVRLPRILHMLIAAQSQITRLERESYDNLARIESCLSVMLTEPSLHAALAREHKITVQETMTRLDDRLRSQREVMQDAISRLDDRLHGKREVMQSAISGLDDRLRSEREMMQNAISRLESDVAGSSQHLETASHGLRQAQIKLGDLWGHIVDQQRRLDILLLEARRRLPEKFDEQQLQVFVLEKDNQLQAWYAGFEDRYRGTRMDILERQRIYLPAIKEAVDAVGDKPLLDIGCGRGEFLELLREGGFTGRGIDINPTMVARCSEQGLEVDEAEALSWLRSLSANSLAGVTGFHIIEHIPFPILTEIFDECLRVIAPGGLVIFETPNPGNLLVAAERFYLDPTHISPLPSSTISFVIEARGFTCVSVLSLHPVPGVEHRAYDDPMFALLQEKLYGPQDYGIVAWKAK